MKILGIEIPLSVKIGKNFTISHWGYGTVIHPYTRIGNNVKIYQGVTIGRSNIYENIDNDLKEIIIEDNVIFSAGSKVLVKKSCTIKAGTIIGANAVLIVDKSSIEKGVYVGIPAKNISKS